MEKVMKKFNFGDNFMKWVNIIYNDPNLVIKNNGWLSSKIHMRRGIRQGCPLSALLFILCVEVMAIKLRDSDDVSGFNFENHVYKVTQYDDDTTITVRDLESVAHALNIISDFGDVSGLKLNRDKCEGILLGGLKNSVHELHGIKFSNEPVRCLGIHIGHNVIKCNELNWLPKVKKIESLLEVWKTRNLTLFGKVMVIKSLAISQLVYNMTVLDVDHDMIKKLERLFFQFL